MSKAEDEYAGYISFQIDSDGDPETLIVHHDRAYVETWRTKSDERRLRRSRVRPAEETPPQPPEEEANPLSLLTKEYVRAILGFHRLITVNSIMLPMIRQSYIRKNFYQPAQKNLTRLDVGEGDPLFGLKIKDYRQINQNISKLSEIDRSIEALPTAILLGLVATFDAFIVDTVKALLRLRAGRYENSTRTLSVKDILSMNSFEDVKEKIIEDELDSLMRGSHEDQIKFIEVNFNVKIIDTYEKWGDFIEIFERRNLAAHGMSTVNRYYVDNCSRAGANISDIELGDILILSPEYLHDSVNRLAEFGVLMLFVLWRQNFDDKEFKAFKSVSDIAYDLIKDGNFGVASNVLEVVIKSKAKIPDSLKKMMTVNLANAHKKAGNESRCSAVLDNMDWSAASDDYKICVASLTGDVAKVEALMSRVAQSGIVGKEEFRDWPAFDWVRSESFFQEKFQELFGEPIVVVNESSGEDDSSIGLFEIVETKH